jgi:hypothetical protein
MKSMRKGRKCPKCGYEKNAAEAGWCGLCYEPFNKAGKQAETAAAAQPAPPQPTQPDLVRAAKPLLLAVVALLGIAAALWDHKASGDAKSSGATAENLFAAQTAEADRLLEAHRAEQAAFLTEIETDGLDPEGFGIEGGYTKKLFKLQDSYASAVNALKLPCPSCVDKEKDAPYLAWTQAHQLRETEIMNDFNARYARLVKLSAAASR